MKLKKLLSVLIVISIMCSLFGGFSAFAAKSKYEQCNFIVDSEMELLATSFGTWGVTSASVMEGIAHSGNRSLKQVSDGRVINRVIVENLIPGEEYTFTAWLYIKELKAASAELGGILKIEFMGGGKYLLDVSDVFAGNTGKWTKCTISGVAPEGVELASLQLRMDCGGEIYWDDVTFVGSATKEDAEIMRERNAAGLAAWERSCELLEQQMAEEAAIGLAPGAANAMPNPSFEELNASGDGAESWIPYGGNWGTVVSVTDEKARTGEHSVKLAPAADSYMPWVKQNLKGSFVADTLYTLSAWVNVENLERGDTLFMKLEFYSGQDTGVSNYISAAESGVFTFEPDGEWHKISTVFPMPANTAVISAYFRVSHGKGNNVIYYDDIELGPASVTSLMQFAPDFTFNYTDVENIKTSTTINCISKPIEAGSTVEYTVKDGEQVIASETLLASPTMSWSFPTSTLAEQGKAYTISAAYKGADGTIIEESVPKRIYRYDRPTMLDKQNRIIIDGEPLSPVVLYGALKEDYAKYAEAGITIIRPGDVSMSETRYMEDVRDILDTAHAHGLKVLYALYGAPAGHPYAIAKTKILVNEFKDHPALLAWMLMDEPSNFVPPNGTTAQSFTEMVEYLEEGYKVVRSIDTYHPVYICECTSRDDSYEKSFQNVDIACIDPYPNDKTEQTLAYVCAEKAVDSVHGEREVWSLGYASLWNKDYVPDSDGYRMHAYISMWGGAKGIGYYIDEHLGEDLIATMLECNTSGELDIALDHFVRHNTPVFDEYMGRNYWYRSWIAQDGKMYLLVKENKNDGKNTAVNFNIKSTNGLIEINGYTAKLVNGTTDKVVASNDSSFNLTMTPTQISLYEIIPNNPVDFGAVSTPAYNDLAGFEWAQEAVENITKNKIANNKGAHIYAPGENITRGDFAMYLIRTLGLNADTTDQFTDVDPNAEYAKEVAIGKALGILKGSGDGNYNPEEPISRQDLMVICARGLRMASRLFDADSSAVLATFIDSNLIADYATNDIGAMVSSKIITGNPDRTINPLGNTTRAEAAVIMDRIYK